MKKPTKEARSAPRPQSSRRSFLKKAAVGAAGAAVATAPTIHVAQAPTTLRFQSTWPTKDIFHEYALDFAKKVNEMAGGRLKIEVLPAGAVVKAFDLLDAVSKGTLDGGHGVVAYWYGKNTALALWGSGPSFGMDPNMLLAWHYYGGGKELQEEIYKSLNLDVVSFLYGPMPTQPLGWFKKPVAKAEDMKGLKFRTVGLSIDIFTGLGAAVNALPGAEIVPALDRGLLDAAEFNNASSDRVLGFPDVVEDLHAAELPPVRRAVRDPLQQGQVRRAPGRASHIIGYAVAGGLAPTCRWKAIDRYSTTTWRCREAGREVLQDARRDPEAAARDLGRGDGRSGPPRTRCSRRCSTRSGPSRARAARWQADTQVDFRMAYNHFFGEEEGELRRPRRPPGLAGDRLLLGGGAELSTIDKSATARSRWLIVALTALITWEVLSRKFLDTPHAWVFDAQIMLYGTLFMMAGAYTLAKNGHVRGDVLYGFFPARLQASLDLVLYLSSSCPGARDGLRRLDLRRASRWAIREHSTIMVDGPPDLSVQVHHPARRRAHPAAGGGRDRPLRGLRCGTAPGRRGRRTSRRSTSTS